MPQPMTITWTRSPANPVGYRVIGYAAAALASLAVWAGAAALVIRLIG